MLGLQVPLNLLTSDAFCDAVLDKLTVAAGLPANSNALGLARWDLKAALTDTIATVYASEQEDDDDPIDDRPIIGHCSKCGEAREDDYTCREGGSTVPLAERGKQ